MHERAAGDCVRTHTPSPSQSPSSYTITTIALECRRGRTHRPPPLSKLTAAPRPQVGVGVLRRDGPCGWLDSPGAWGKKTSF